MKRVNKLSISRQSKGFTIVELLIVICVIGILAAITSMSYSGIKQRADEASLNVDLKNASTQFKLYRAEYDSYPTALDANFCPTLPNNDPKYCLKSSSGNEFQNYSGTATTYVLEAKNGTTAFYINQDKSPTVLVSYTKLLIHADGINGSTSFTDSELTPKPISANGNAVVSTAQSKFGGASAYMNDSSGYLQFANSSDFDFGTENFTLDFWFYMTGHPLSNNYSSFIISREDWANYFVFFIGSSDYGGGPLAGLGYNIDGTATNKGSIIYANEGVYSYSLNTWYHVALVRDGANLNLYKNGTLLNTNNIGASTTIKFPTNNVQFGRHLYMSCNAGDYCQLRGFADEIRISKGIARWTSNFTPPTQAYSN